MIIDITHFLLKNCWLLHVCIYIYCVACCCLAFCCAPLCVRRFGALLTVITTAANPLTSHREPCESGTCLQRPHLFPWQESVLLVEVALATVITTAANPQKSHREPCESGICPQRPHLFSWQESVLLVEVQRRRECLGRPVHLRWRRRFKWRFLRCARIWHIPLTDFQFIHLHCR